MKKNYNKIQQVCIALCVATGIQAQTPQLVKDINTSANGGMHSSNSSTGIVLGSNSYFVATDKLHGEELWKTDGTPAGTVLLKDINLGVIGSAPSNLTLLGSYIYFSANNGINGAELWRTDGTASGTTLVKDICTGLSSSNPNYLVATGGYVYFSASDAVNGYELWKTNGATTTLIDINAGAASSYPTYLAVFGTSVIFTANDGIIGNEPWITNGTTTTVLQDIETGIGSSNPNRFFVNGSTIYFNATTASMGQEPWKSDGTNAGTNLIADMEPGTSGTTIYDYKALGANTLLSAIFTGSVSNEWYITDGTTITLVKDINPASYYSGLSGSSSEAFGGFVYFGANNGSSGTELWRTDGTLVGTTLVKDINVGIGTSYPYNFSKPYGGFIYFSADNGINGSELWRTDGTTLGTTLVKNICGIGGTLSSYPSNFAVLGTQLIFQANNDSINGNNSELWQTNGTVAGTTLLKNIYADTVNTDTGFNAGMSVVNNKLIFSVYQDTIGTELYMSNGTTAGTQFLKDINVGVNGSDPSNFTTIGAITFFRADDGVNGTELWKTDGTIAGTVLVKDINISSGSGSYPNYFRAMGNILYFSADDGVNGTELWKSDGTPGGTTLVMDINSTGSSYPEPIQIMGNFLYFVADNGTNGYELWKTDGTNTNMVADINVGTGSGYPQVTGSSVLGVFMYFRADNGSGGMLFKTDGITITPLGVQMYNSEFAVSGNKLYFAATDATNGEELWYTDGTTTALVKDIESGPNDSYPYNLVSSGNSLYFVAYNTNYGEELWKSDGTAVGTVLVKDIRVGSSDSNIDNITALDGRVFFRATDGIYGTELWQSDGTTTGTVQFDINPGSGSSYPNYLTAMNNALYFGAYTDLNGRELWKLTPTTAVNTASIATAYCKGAATTVSFTAFGTVNTGNVYTAELSDATGAFTSPIAIGSVSSSSLQGSIAANIPTLITAGNAYRIRVSSSNVLANGLDNGSNITINSLPVINVVSSATAICLGNTATITASGIISYTWSNAANTAAIIVTPTINTTYSIIGTDANGCANNALYTQTVSACTGINELTNAAFNVMVFPNPTAGVLTINSNRDLGNEATIEIMNIMGAIVYKQTVSASNLTINVSNLSAGIYYLKLISNNTISNAKFTKE